MAVLEIKNLIFSYPKASINALNGVDLTVKAGEICIVCGKSGSGKSTLLRLLKKEIAPYGKIGGEINISADKIGFVNQNVESNIVTDTVYGELAFSLQNTDMSKAEISLRIAETASYFNLNKYINERVENLSGGIKQMLSLASVMADMPEILVLDEPCSQLDPISAEMFMNAVLRLNREQGITVIISEHRAADLLCSADKVLFLDCGKSAFFGKAADFAEFLVDSDNDMKNILPPYTLLLKSRTLEFANAKNEMREVKEKPFPPIQRVERALTAKGISFAYKRGFADVLFDLCYSAERGKINAIIGANSSGKTTLLKCLAKILKPYSGRIKADGKIAYMPQNVQSMLLEDTVYQEVSDDKLLKMLNLYDFKGRNPFDLSGGELQRLALAKMLASGADILLLDEPTKSVDAAFKAELADIFHKLCQTGKTIIMVTHDLEFAGRYTDNAAFLFDGKIASAESAKKLFSSLDIYTTSLSRLTGGRIVSVDDAEVEK